jgi:hypothetical protein
MLVAVDAGEAEILAFAEAFSSPDRAGRVTAPRYTDLLRRLRDQSDGMDLVAIIRSPLPSTPVAMVSATPGA